MALATLSIDIVAKLAGLEAGMNRAERMVQQSTAKMSAHFDKMQAAAGAIGAAGGLLGGTFAVAGLAEWLRATTNGIDALSDLADITGASVENLSALEAAAGRTGHTMDTVGDAVLKLNKLLNEGEPDSPTNKALAEIGLSAEKLRELDPALALKAVADALAEYRDDADKARLVQDLFGKSVREVGPLLKDLAESGALVATVTREQAEQASTWNKQLAALNANATDLSRTLVLKLLPGMNEYLLTMRELSKGPGLAAAAGEFMWRSFDTPTAALEHYTAELQRVEKQIKSTEALIKDDSRPQMALANRNLLLGLQDERAKIQKFVTAYTNTVKGAAGAAGLDDRPALGGAGGAGGGRRAGGPLRATQAAGREVESYADSVAQAVARMVSDTDVVRLGELNAQLAELSRLAAAGLDPQIVGQVRARLEGQMPKAMPNQAAEDFRRLELGSDAALESLLQYNNQADRLNQLLSGTTSALLDGQRRDMLLLAEAFERGAVSEQQYLEAVQQRLAEGAQGADKAKTAAQELGLTFTSAFEDAVVGGKDAGDILKGLEQDLLRLGARKWVITPIINAAGNWLDSAGGVGGILGSLFGGLFANGGAFGRSAPIPFAAGGVFNSPHLFKFAQGGALATGVLGEAGPEAIMPLFRGPGGKLGVQAIGAAGGGVVINQTNHIGAGVSRNEVMAAMQVAKAQAIAEIEDARQRGRSGAA